MTRRALVMAGGGMRVAWQSGAVQALHESGLRFDHGDGTSGGMFTLGMLLSGVPVDELGDRWRTLRVPTFVAPLPLRGYLKSPTDWAALGGASGVEHKVMPHLGIDLAAVRASRGMTGTFNVADFGTKTCVPIPQDEIDPPRFVAGVSLAGVMPAVHAHGTTWTDAVWIQDANLREAVRRGCTEIWVLWCIANNPRWGNGLLEQYVHMIELSANSALAAELEWIADLNSRREQPVVVHVVTPNLPLPLDPDFVTGRIDAETLVAQGYRDTCRYLATSTDGGSPLDASATATADRPLGLRAVLRCRGELVGAGHAGAAAVTVVAEVDDVEAQAEDPGLPFSVVGGLVHPVFGYRPFERGSAVISGGELRVAAHLMLDGEPHTLGVVMRGRRQTWTLRAGDDASVALGGGVMTGRQSLGALFSVEPSGAHDLRSRVRAVGLGASVLRAARPAPRIPRPRAATDRVPGRSPAGSRGGTD